MTIADEKRRLRVSSGQARDLAATACPGAGEVLAARFIDGLAPELAGRAGATVSAYWPVRSEIDVRPLIARLNEMGHPTALPVVAAPGQPLVFRRWTPGDPLEAAGFGLRVPVDTAPETEPGILIVPFLAADTSGYRLGYGGGYFDRTLDRLRAAGEILAIGVGFDGQIVASVPRGPHDARLDWIVTQRRAIDCRQPADGSG